MARDGLVPRAFFGAIHDEVPDALEGDHPDRRLRRPSVAAFLPLRVLADLTNIGTLFAFVVVCGAVLIMRRDAPRGGAAVPRALRARWCPILGIVTCLILMFSLAPENWCRLFVWLALGFVIYFGYGRKHSVLARLRAQGKLPAR